MKKLIALVSTILVNVLLSSGVVQTETPKPPEVFLFQDFEAAVLTPNGDYLYPHQYGPQGSANIVLDPTDTVSGKQSIAFTLNSGRMYPQWVPANRNNAKAGAIFPEGFAREYADNPAGWKLNTYDRFSVWVKIPLTDKLGQTTLGTYNKQYGPLPDYDWSHNDEFGGNHYYFLVTLPNTDTWVHLILNQHPFHQRGGMGSTEWGVQPYPTCATAARPDGALLNPGSAYVADCGTHNSFDTLTRFYFEFDPYLTDVPPYPRTYKFDKLEFYRSQWQEADAQVSSISATYSNAGRVHLAWTRDKSDAVTKHEVRYAYSDIHAMGWAAATPAPNGVVTPSTSGDYRMFYNDSTIPIAGHSTLYLAIKPANSNLFSQIDVPIPGGPVTPPPAVPVMTSVNPSSGLQGVVIPVTVTGSSFTSPLTVQAGPGISASAIVVSAAIATFSLTISGTAALGPRPLAVSTANGASNALTFTVAAPPPPTLAPLTAAPVKKTALLLTAGDISTVVVKPVACSTTKDFFLVDAAKLEAAGMLAGLPGFDGRLARYPEITELLAYWDTRGVAAGCYTVTQSSQKLGVRVRVAR